MSRVTFEQLLIEAIPKLEKELDLYKLAHRQKADQLLSCEKALKERDDEIISKNERIAELEKDKLLLIEDRARFPDKPDMIGRMIGCNSKNKDNLIEVHKKSI